MPRLLRFADNDYSMAPACKGSYLAYDTTRRTTGVNVLLAVPIFRSLQDIYGNGE